MKLTLFLQEASTLGYTGLPTAAETSESNRIDCRHDVHKIALDTVGRIVRRSEQGSTWHDNVIGLSTWVTNIYKMMVTQSQDEVCAKAFCDISTSFSESVKVVCLAHKPAPCSQEHNAPPSFAAG